MIAVRGRRTLLLVCHAIDEEAIAVFCVEVSSSPRDFWECLCTSGNAENTEGESDSSRVGFGVHQTSAEA